MLSTTIELRRMVVAMYEEQFSKRLTELRTQKGVSARDMSLSIGQNPGYGQSCQTARMEEIRFSHLYGLQRQVPQGCPADEILINQRKGHYDD